MINSTLSGFFNLNNAKYFIIIINLILKHFILKCFNNAVFFLMISIFSQNTLVFYFFFSSKLDSHLKLRSKQFFFYKVVKMMSIIKKKLIRRSGFMVVWCRGF